MKVKNLYRDVTKRGAFLKLLPFQGDRRAAIITQGAALGYELLPFQGVLINCRPSLQTSPKGANRKRHAKNAKVPARRPAGFEIRR